MSNIYPFLLLKKALRYYIVNLGIVTFASLCVLCTANSVGATFSEELFDSFLEDVNYCHRNIGYSRASVRKVNEL